MKVIVIYSPPKPGLPYLVASFTQDGAEILQARDKDTARELVIKLKSGKAVAGRKKSRINPAGGA